MQAILTAFRIAGERAVDVIGSPAARGAWTAASALEAYTVGALAGHMLLATARLEVVLDEVEPLSASPVGLAAFYGANRVDDGDEIDTGLHPVIRALASETAERGPDAVVADLAAVLDRLRMRLPDERASRLVPVVNVRGGSTTLDTYLRTRVVELAVHGDDLAASVGLTFDVPLAVADVVFGVCLDLARARAGDLQVLRAFVRRERADPGVLRVL